MKAVESEGNSVEEAVNRALILLGIPRDDAEVEVLRDPQSAPGEAALVRVSPRGAETEPVTRPPAPKVSTQPEPREDPAPQLREDPAPRDEPEANDEASVHEEQESERVNVSGETTAWESRPGSRSVREQEDRAVEFLDELLELLDADCAVGVMPAGNDGRITLELTGPDTGLLIGRKAQTLDAAEFLLNRALDHEAAGGPRVSLDAEGYRRRREEKLQSIAKEQAAEVRRSGEAIELEPMSPRDRRTIHIALRDDAEVETHSEGDGLERRVVIEPADW